MVEVIGSTPIFSTNEAEKSPSKKFGGDFSLHCPEVKLRSGFYFRATHTIAPPKKFGGDFSFLLLPEVAIWLYLQVITTCGYMLNFICKMALHHCVYVLFSAKDHLLYIGYTSNLEVRFQKHQEGGVKSTAKRGPLMLIFTEHYLFKEDALKREGYFKTTMGKKAIKLMLNRTLDQLGHKKATSPDVLFDEE